MLKNIFLFTGEEKYLLNKELKRRKENFREKFSKDSIFIFNSENFDAEKVNESIWAGGLFFSKKLIIIFGIPTDTDNSNKLLVSVSEKRNEEFLKKKGEIPQDVLLIFVSYKPDKRLKFYKFLNENANIKNFGGKRDIDYKNFLSENLKNLEFEENCIEYFYFKVGKSFYRLENEIEKVILYCQKNNITKLDCKIIDKVVFSDTEINSFEIFDNFFTDKKKVLEIIDENSKSGTDRNKYIGMLYRGLKLYIFLIDFHKKGISDSRTIAQAIKYHPFAINKNIKDIEKILENYKNIKKIYNNLIQIDFGIKSGKYPDSYFWLAIKKTIYENL